MNIQNINVKDIKPYPNNAKKHPKIQIDNVAQSIDKFGFVQPIVLSKDNVVVIGHCRLLAAKQLKLAEVPCLYVDDLTDEQIQMLRNLDNKLNESEWDFDLLKDDIDGLDFSDFDIDWGLGDLSEQEVDDNQYEQQSLKENTTKLHICPCCGCEFED